MVFRVGKNKASTTISIGVKIQYLNHDFTYENIIPPVTHIIKLGPTIDDLMYSGGTNYH